MHHHAKFGANRTSIIIGVEANDTLSMLVSQIEQKYKYGGRSVYQKKSTEDVLKLQKYRCQ